MCLKNENNVECANNVTTFSGCGRYIHKTCLTSYPHTKYPVNISITPWARGRNFTYRYHLWWQRLVTIFRIGHVSAIYFDMIALSGWLLKIVMSSFIPTPNEMLPE